MPRPNDWMNESYMNIKEDNRPYMDPYLKDMINKSFVIFERMKRGRRKFTLLVTGKKMCVVVFLVDNQIKSLRR